MKNKIVVITGATNGIGLETARALAAREAIVHLVGRSSTKLDQSVHALRRETGSETVFAWRADLSSLAETRQLAADLITSLPRIDVLINNAGALFERREVTPEGFERTWALNHLSPFLLTNLLLSRLRASGAARVITTSSMIHSAARIEFDDVSMRKSYSGWRAYGQSKLANILFSSALARRVEADGITSNSLHPGMVASGFAQNNGLAYRVAMGPLYRLVALTPAQGARTPIFLATSPDVATVTGKYFAFAKARAPSEAARSVPDQERLWALSVEQTGLDVTPPEPNGQPSH
ncbi:MAG: SDR family oxidoreductase [Thermoflexales bacterium]|nr:SDR family oxidoreductase [Thermoflexales bacterium]